MDDLKRDSNDLNDNKCHYDYDKHKSNFKTIYLVRIGNR